MFMKRILATALFSTILLSATKCGDKQDHANTRYKGRLEVQGICMNYTISVIEGDMDTSSIVASWTDEVANKTYTKVFRLDNPCDFPSTIRQGDEFYFTIDSVKDKQCAVCMAYYPTPPKALKIKVVP